MALVERFPTVEVLNLGALSFTEHWITLVGGGFKVARVEGEKSTNLFTVGEPVKEVSLVTIRSVIYVAHQEFLNSIFSKSAF